MDKNNMLIEKTYRKVKLVVPIQKQLDSWLMLRTTEDNLQKAVYSLYNKSK